MRPTLNVEKAKDKARKFELKGQYEKAIELYVKILNELDGTPELAQELSLFNKVGDLHLKAGAVHEAVEMYERAVNLYSDSGLANNAIALCNKILRNSPGRTQIYLKLAQLMVERGFVAEAKQNLLEYAERMQRAGRLEEAFQALKEFADLSPANEEIRLLLAEQLKAAARTDEAREQLDKLYAELQAQGSDTRRSRATLEKIRAIDPDYEVDDSVLVPTQSKQGKTSDLVFLDLGEAAGGEGEGAVEAPRGPAVVDPGDQELRIERTTIDFSPSGTEVGAIEGLEDAWADEPQVEVPALDFEPTSLAGDEPSSGGEPADDLGADAAFSDDDVPVIELPEEEAEGADAPLAILEVPDPDDVELAEEPVAAVEGLDTLEVDLESGGGVEVPELDLEGFDDADAEALALPELADDAVPAGPATAPPIVPLTVEELEERVADDPDHPDLHRELGEALIGDGQRERGLEELDIALTAYEARQDWSQTERLVEELLRLEPNSTRHHQKRVEAAYRRGDKGRLVEAYLGLAGALVRTGEVDRGRMVYQRVVEHDPGNEVAGSSLAALEPEPEEAPPAPAPRAPASREEPAVDRGAAAFVDLESLVMGDEARVKDTRMRIEEEEPTGDEQRDFERMLSLFKRGIEQNLEDDDAQAHYDLGIAFKEMGLLDEAIAEFQKALRAVDGRLRTAEALGVCFFEKGQFSVAGTVLKRALESEPGGDDKKINLLYWLGRCEEEQGKHPEALKHYQRVFAVDIDFADVNTRVRQLAEAGH